MKTGEQQINQFCYFFFFTEFPNVVEWKLLLFNGKA